MPEHLILHERNALALDRVRHDARRAPRLEREPREHLVDRAHIVAVDLRHGPAERLPLRRERFQGEHVLDAAARERLSRNTEGVIAKQNLSRELAINRIRDALRRGGAEARS